ncbi:MAG: MBL fold metallo-hydrolase [Deltaproteobacteria bacterium]|nr:MBL fold metallo-hydrolase [Deltaproteobacteria bacterium]
MSAPSDLYFAQQLVGEMQNLAYLIGSREQRQALVVDPAWNVQGLLDQAAEDDIEVVGALVTHYHQDHVGGEVFGMNIEGLGKLLEAQPMPVHVNKHEAEGLKKVTGISDTDLVQHEGGDLLALGGVGIRLIHTPGHTPGSQCFLVEESDQAGHLVAGDTLFLNGCGRVDLPGADPRAMYESLERLKTLPDDTTLFPGHLYSPEGHDSLAGQKRTNPYLRAASVDQFLGFLGY